MVNVMYPAFFIKKTEKIKSGGINASLHIHLMHLFYELILFGEWMPLPFAL